MPTSESPLKEPGSGAPLVSVIVPAFNAASTVLETLDSIRRQTMEDFEIIVIDDGSTDDTLARLHTFDDPRVRIFSYPNAGLATARNRGLERARGEFVSFIDSDDMWTPDKLELQVKALRLNPEAAFAYSWTVFVDHQGRYLFAKQPCYAEGHVFADLLRECFLASGSNIFVRRACANALGGFDSRLPAAQDWDFALRIAARWQFAVVPRYQIIYRITEGAMSGNVQRCEHACESIVNHALEAGERIPLPDPKEAIANVRQYAAFLFLTRAMDVDATRSAGHKLLEHIRTYPRVLLTFKTWHILFAWGVTEVVPTRLRRRAVIALLRTYGRWLIIRRGEVRQFLRARASAEGEG